MNSSTHSSRFLNGTETRCAKCVPAGEEEHCKWSQAEVRGRSRVKKHCVSLKEMEAEAREKATQKLDFFPGQTFQLEVGVMGQGTEVAQSEGQGW